MVLPLPISAAATTIDITTVTPIFDNVKKAQNDNDYDKTIQFGTDTINCIQQLQLVSILEHRAFALGMKSKFDAAIKDARTIIKYAPKIPLGYLRLGNLLNMQGKQAKAVKVYEMALDRIPADDPLYFQLVQGKEKAHEKLNQRLDLIAALPLEIVDKIIVLLPEVDRAKLFDVSIFWSKRLSNCHLAWAEITNDHDDNNALDIVAQRLPQIANHIQKLTISTESSEVWHDYLAHMDGGYFKKIKSLTLDQTTSNNVLRINSIMTLTSAFWTMRYTLTSFKIRMTYCNIPLKIADILFYCPNLQTLALDTQDQLLDILGDMTVLTEPHRSIVDLTVDTYRTSGDALGPLLKACPFVKRLRLEFAPTDAFYAVCDYCPNLEVFGFNPGYVLPDMNGLLNREYDNKNPVLPPSDDNNAIIPEEGRLRAFYSKNGGQGIPGNEFMKLLQKNQKTLEILYANLSKTTEQSDNEEPHANFRPDYAVKAADVKCLDRLSSLTYWPDIYGVFEPLFLRTVVGTSIKHVNPICSSDIPSIVHTLMELPPLESLELTNIFIDDEEDGEGAKDNAAQSLIRLLKSYAVSSDPTKKLKLVAFENANFISDEVLDVLADIETLDELKFHGTSNFTPQGLKNYFNKLKKKNNAAQITKLKLSDLGDVVDSNDTLLEVLNTMTGLETLWLDELPRITDAAIRNLADSMKGLQNLTVKHCVRVRSKKTVPYVNNRKKFKHVDIIVNLDSDDEEDDYEDDEDMDSDWIPM